MKLCKDCKHVGGSVEHRRCLAPQNNAGDLVNGEYNPRWLYCNTMREHHWIDAYNMKQCGRSGRWFELNQE